MNQEFKKCLESGKIVSFPKGKELSGKELSVARSDLLDAKAGYESQRYKWSTIQGYYAMFHAARALVYSRGYREKSHYCLSVALRALFVEEGKLYAQTGRDFLNAMNLRQAADYEATFSLEGARAVIASAERFIEKAATILGPIQ
ncbi:MAG: HEPN domain-containing protein [Chloroflexi bacterium]|nr:HEPN domain-containing protein [Chloroflexota bacterium]